MAVPTVSTDPAPWAADSLTHLLGRDVQPIFTVRTSPWRLCTQHTPAHVLQGAVLDAWDVEVSYDTNRNPYAHAKMSVAMSGLSYARNPQYGQSIEILAGYQRGAVRDEQVIFYGLVTSSEYGFDEDGRKSLQIEADSVEVWWDHPFKTGTWNVANTLSSIAAQVAAMNAEPARFYRTPLQVAALGTLNTPTAGQLSAFRDLEIQAGENLQDWFVNLAATLGQKLRGDHRHRVPDTIPASGGVSLVHDGVDWYPSITSKSWIVSDAGRYAGTPILDLTGLVDSVKLRESANDYANFLDFTAQWGVGGATKATKLIPALPNDEANWGILKVQSLTVNMRPTGGVLNVTDPVALRWAEAYYRRTWTATITGRACYWLDCDQRIQWPNPDALFGFTKYDGEIAALTFHVDAGLMTITARPHTA